MALLGLAFVGACASAPATETRPAPVADASAQACAVQVDDAAIAGRHIEADGLSLCVPTHWRSSGPVAWRFTGGNVAVVPLADAQRTRGYFASTGPHAASEVLWRQAQVETVTSGSGGSSQAARMEGGVSTGYVDRTVPAPREWREELDGYSAHFIVSMDPTGRWYAAATLTSGSATISARGFAASVAGVEEQLAVFRTLRITDAALSR